MIGAGAKNGRTGLWLCGIVVGMVGMSYAAVPLYNLFCDVTGFGGTTQVSSGPTGPVLEREVRVRFAATTNYDMPWDFRPEVREVTLNVGEQGFIAYEAKNPTEKPITGMATFNVTPLKAGYYFSKIQCFCFEQQTLAPGQEVSMPVMFYVDPAIAEDPNMDDVDVITLSYTFFRSDEDELDAGDQTVYQSEMPAEAQQVGG